MDEGGTAFSSTHSLRGMMGGGVQWKTGAARGNPGRNHFSFANKPSQLTSSSDCPAFCRTNLPLIFIFS